MAFSRGTNFGIRSPRSAAALGGDTVKTFYVDDLLTRWFVNKGQGFKLAVSGVGTTDFIELDDDASLYSASVIAADIQTKLEALTGFSGKVTVDGASQEAGDKYFFTAIFDESLGAISWDYADAVWDCPCVVGETTTQAAVEEVVVIEAIGSDDTTVDSNGAFGNRVSNDGDGNFSNASPSAGWTAGTPAGSVVAFTADDPGAFNTTKISGAGTVVVTTPGKNVEHSLTPTPAPPASGTWKPYASRSSIDYNASTTDIVSQIGGNFGGGVVTASQRLDQGVVVIKQNDPLDVADGILSPDSGTLRTAPLTHSIS